MTKFTEFINEATITSRITSYLKSVGAKNVTVFKSNEPAYKGIGFSYDDTNSDDWITEFANKFEKDINNEYVLTPYSITITAYKKSQYAEYKNEALFKEFKKLK